MTPKAAAQPLAAGEKDQRVGRRVRQGLIRDLKRGLSEAQSVVVVKTQNVSTRDLNALRLSLKGMQSNLFIVRNSLGALAFRELGWTDLEKDLVGTCGVSPIRGDVAAVAKLLANFSKDHEGFALQGGLLNGAPLTSQEIAVLSRLPAREVLLSQLAGILQSPLRNLAFVLQGPIRSLVLLVNAVGKKREVAVKENVQSNG
jgi:large subunit ribosomal protein L10